MSGAHTYLFPRYPPEAQDGGVLCLCDRVHEGGHEASQGPAASATSAGAALESPPAASVVERNGRAPMLLPHRRPPNPLHSLAEEGIAGQWWRGGTEIAHPTLEASAEISQGRGIESSICSRACTIAHEHCMATVHRNVRLHSGAPHHTHRTQRQHALSRCGGCSGYRPHGVTLRSGRGALPSGREFQDVGGDLD